MKFSDEFILLLKARYPLIYISTQEEDRLEYIIRKSVQNVLSRGIFTWDFVDGYNINKINQGIAKRNPLQALEFIETFAPETPNVFILKDFQKFFADIGISRKLKNLTRSFKIQPKTIIILTTNIVIPDELRDCITIIKFQLPQLYEIKKELQKVLNSLNQKIDNQILEVLSQACQGLSFERIRRVLSKAIATFKKIDERTITLVLNEKSQLILQTEILEFWPATEKLEDIGGLENLKDWLKKRSNSFSEKAFNYGLPIPRGLLLVGIQGTGKSLIAKSIAHEWKLPLLKLDVGKLFAGIVGESELRIRQMIEIAEALSPCILWIDEIDKAFKDSKGDSGTTNRVFSTFLIWLSEKKSSVFIVATANDISTLPLEIIRKGRFDEIFFIGLPTFEERKIIFKIHLSLLRPETWKFYNINLLSEKTENFSGAEIRQSIIEAMHLGFYEKREFTTTDIFFSIQQIIPLAQVDPEKIEKLQNWSLSGKIRLASKLL
uniref:Ycf46 n=1 Tax=Vacuolaria virescens TaxID=44451 RepID=UPI0021159DE7|nr:Ycf46 [Vacuolaria virescens]UTE94714.1 Ycf46 [Vacuolaria virescens]